MNKLFFNRSGEKRFRYSVTNVESGETFNVSGPKSSVTWGLDFSEWTMLIRLSRENKPSKEDAAEDLLLLSLMPEKSRDRIFSILGL